MAVRDLATWLLATDEFQLRYRKIVLDAARVDIAGKPIESAPEPTPHDWPYLLLAASVLAMAPESSAEAAACRDAALRIAQFCLSAGAAAGAGATAAEDGRRPTLVQRATAASVLDLLVNRPAIDLAARRHLIDPGVTASLPVPIRLESLRRQLLHEVPLHGGTYLAVNRFQRRVWSALDDCTWVSFSAPTSAGKSFAVMHWVADFVTRYPSANLVYLVPTRALISEVEGELRRLLRQSDGYGDPVTSLPLIPPGSAMRPRVFVFTQERLHLLLTSSPSTRVDVLIVDEAHKLGDGHRGVLLQQVIERVLGRGHGTKVVFASPMTSNPESLLEDAPSGVRASSFVSREVTVNQNLYWVSQAPGKPRAWTIAIILNGESVPLKTLELPSTPTTVGKRLPLVAHAMGATGGNILYVNGAADAEKAALVLYDLVGKEADITANAEVAALIDVARRTIHRDFALARTLERGVAFHYGNLPLLIRSEVERLFTSGVLRYLVCTSTLIEGVNMACRSIFVRGPTKGRGRPMTPDDFWNLAGRAGRWGREFQGSIICVDADRDEVWKPSGPPIARSQFVIRRTAVATVADPTDLLGFIERRSPRAEAVKRPDLEFVFSYLMSHQMRRGSIRHLPWVERLAATAVERISGALTESARSVVTPVEIVERNPGISPIAMDDLLQRFARPDRDPRELLPVHPASTDAVDVYRKILGRIAGSLNAALGPEGPRPHALAILITHWMRGYSLARLISDRLKWENEHKRKKSTAAVIRAVLGDVEQIARFEAPRSLACYTDLLRHYFVQIGRPELANELQGDLGLWLEFGVADPTLISMIGLGLSRSSAVLLGEILARGTLTPDEVLEWLRQGTWRTADLPVLVRSEVELLLGLHDPSGRS